MTDTIDVYWSFRSPYSYLVTPDLLKLRDDYDVEVNLRVVLPIAIRAKGTLFDKSNMNKARYIVMDSMRRAQMLGLPMAYPNPDPIVQDFETFEVAEEQPYIYRLSALGVEAQRLGKGIDFIASVSRLIFGGTKDWDKGDLLAGAVATADLDLAQMEDAIKNGDHMDEIERNQKALGGIGHWGVPTMAVRGEPFFGQDRIDTLRWRLDQLGIAKR